MNALAPCRFPKRALAVLVVFATLVGGVYLLLLASAESVHGTAYASATPTSVSHEAWQKQNALVVRNLENWSDPVVLSSTSPVTAQYATASWATDRTISIGDTFTTYRRDAPYNDYSGTMLESYSSIAGKMSHVHTDMFNNERAKRDANGLGWGALNISFDALKDGQTGSVTVHYPLVGTYTAPNGSTANVGADVTYTVTADVLAASDPAYQGKVNADAAYYNHMRFGGDGSPFAVTYPASLKNPDCYSKAVISCAKSLYSGVTQYNTSNVKVEVQIVNAGSGAPISVENSYFTIGSLTSSEGVWVARANQVQYPEGGFTLQSDGYVYGDASQPSDADPASGAVLYKDSVTSPTFWRRSATIQQDGTFEFNMVVSPSVKNNPSAQTSGEIQWWALSSFTIAQQEPAAPTKTVDQAIASVGDSLTYTVAQTVGTVGATMSGVYDSFVISDALDPRLSYVSATALAPDGTPLPASAGSFSYDAALNRISYTFSGAYLAVEGATDYAAGMVYKGGVYSIKVATTVNSLGDGSAIANQAGTFINNRESKTNIVQTLLPKPVRGSTVTTYKACAPATNTKVSAGDTIAYTLSSTNTGAVPAPFTLVRDYIPSGTVYSPGSASSNGAYVAADAAGNATGRAYVEWMVKDIAVGATATVSYTVAVDANPPAIILNHALTSQPSQELAPGNPANPEPSNPSNEVKHPTGTDSVGPTINVVKSSDPAPGAFVSGNDVIAYTLSVANSGDSDATDVAVFDAIPANTAYADGSVSSNFSGTHSTETDAVQWVIPTLKAGQTVTVSFAVKVASAIANGTIVSNQASFEQHHPEVPQSPLSNTTNTVQHSVDMAAALEKDLVAISEDGTQATYRITLTANGKSNLIDYVVEDKPANLTYKSSTGDGIYDAEAGCWTIESLEAGKSATVSVAYTINKHPSDIVNYAHPRNDTGFQLMKTRVTSATDMMPATGSVAPGSTIHYLLLLSNTSKDEIIKRTVTDTPGPGLAITAADPDENSGTATITDGGTVIWKTSELAAGSTAKMLVTATVSNDARDTITNKAVSGNHTVVATTPLAAKPPASSPAAAAASLGTALAKTGDALKDHWWIAALATAGATCLIAFRIRRQRSARSRLKRSLARWTLPGR